MLVTGTAGTMSVKPGLKPTTPEFVPAPKRLKPSAVTGPMLKIAEPLLELFPAMRDRVSVSFAFGSFCTPPPWGRAVLPKTVLLVMTAVPLPLLRTPPPVIRDEFPEMVLLLRERTPTFQTPPP